MPIRNFAYYAHCLGVAGFVALFAATLMIGRTMSSFAQGPAQESQATRQEPSADHRFAAGAAFGGIAEVKLGELAQDKASSDAVKAFGKRMADDHKKVGDELKDVATKENISLPQTLSKSDQATYDGLSKLSGVQFDHAYVQAMVEDHEKDVSEFKKEASTGQVPSLKKFASQTLPTLEDHLKHARELAAPQKAGI
jgi:putative membrane protein